MRRLFTSLGWLGPFLLISFFAISGQWTAVVGAAAQAILLIVAVVLLHTPLARAWFEGHELAG